MACADEAGASLAVEVLYGSAPRTVWHWRGRLPAGATLAQALRASGLLAAHPGLDPAQLATGLWGRRCELSTPLRDGDRVEVYRPLAVDPKEARRLRYRQHREAAAERQRQAEARRPATCSSKR